MVNISVSQVLDRAAFYLNDTARAYFTNTVLIEPFKAAYDDMREALVDNSISMMNDVSSAFTIVAGMTDIGGTTGPALPVNFIAALELYERTSGTNNDYAIMENRAFLPKYTVLTSYLQFWAYQHQTIQFIGANGNVEVKMNYIADTLSFAEDDTDRINVFQAKSFLAYRTAAFAAEFLGEDKERANDLNSNATRAIEQLLNMDIKGQQGRVTVRRPYRSGYKRSVLN